MRWLIAVIVGICVLIAVPYVYINDVRDTGVDYETRLSSQYLDNQNNLSSYIGGFYEQLGVANLKSEKLDKILSDAVKGRYEQAGGFGKGGGFFNAIAEAYPNLTGLDVYDKIVNYVSAGRESYRAIQSKLLDMLRGFDSWRQQGIIRSMVVRSLLGMPSERLAARVGDQTWRGEDALEKMYQIVLVEDARRAYQTGTMEPLKVKP